MGWLMYCDGIPGLATRRFQELNGIQRRCVTRIRRAETDSQQWNTVKAGAFLQRAGSEACAFEKSPRRGKGETSKEAQLTRLFQIPAWGHADIDFTVGL